MNNLDILHHMDNLPRSLVKPIRYTFQQLGSMLKADLICDEVLEAIRLFQPSNAVRREIEDLEWNLSFIYVNNDRLWCSEIIWLCGDGKITDACIQMARDANEAITVIRAMIENMKQVAEMRARGGAFQQDFEYNQALEFEQFYRQEENPAIEFEQFEQQEDNPAIEFEQNEQQEEIQVHVLEQVNQPEEIQVHVLEQVNQPEENQVLTYSQNEQQEENQTTAQINELGEAPILHL